MFYLRFFQDTYFTKFLYCLTKKYENEGWLGDPSTKVVDGIKWKGGLDSHTGGINIWSKPFIVKKRGGEVSINCVFYLKFIFNSRTLSCACVFRLQ